MFRLLFNMGLFVLIVIVLAGCASKAYKDDLNTAIHLEGKKKYESAYDFYKQALKSKPNDKHLKQKLGDLRRIIADSQAESAAQAIEDKKYKTAIDHANKALRYEADHKKAMDYGAEAKKQYDEIQKKYSETEGFILKNEWVEAVDTLKEISESYNDDPELGSRIEKCQNDGYRYFMNAGLEARAGGRYSHSLRCFESAELLKSSIESQQEIDTSKKYGDAEALYLRAKLMTEKHSTLEAMELLIQAKDLVDDNEKVNQLILQLTPDWSPKILKKAKDFKASAQIENAFNAIHKLRKINPDYPEAEKFLEEIKSLYLTEKYKKLVEAENAEDFPLVVELSQNLFNLEPEFLDTAEIMTRTGLKVFNLFYQQGLNYMKTGNYGKAILCFNSAEQQLTETQLTRELIEESWEKINEESTLKIVFLDFLQGDGDLSLSRYISEKIRKRLEEGGGGKTFKNITIAFGVTAKNDMITRSGLSNDIDWGSILQNGYNAVITGRIKLLKQDTSVNSEWKTRKRKVNRIIDNEEYSRLIMRRAALKSGMISASRAPVVDNEKYLNIAMKRNMVKENLESSTSNKKAKQKLQEKVNKLNRKMKNVPEKRPMSKNEMEDELELLEARLPTISPKIEAEVEEETPYQLVKHTMTAYMRIDVEILSPGGNHIWPMKHYEDTFQIEDSVIPPNLASEDLSERKGDPLTLPSESVFKEQAIDYIVDKRIVPDLVKNFKSHGIQFYNRANKLHSEQNGSKATAREFLDSFEEYYKFLACYNIKDEGDSLKKDVEIKLESYFSDLWLLRKKKR